MAADSLVTKLKERIDELDTEIQHLQRIRQHYARVLETERHVVGLNGNGSNGSNGSSEKSLTREVQALLTLDRKKVSVRLAALGVILDLEPVSLDKIIHFLDTYEKGSRSKIKPKDRVRSCLWPDRTKGRIDRDSGGRYVFVSDEAREWAHGIIKRKLMRR